MRGSGQIHRDDLWVDLVARERGRGLSDEQLAKRLAVEMYRAAWACGAGEADIGLFGPKLFLAHAWGIVTQPGSHSGVKA